MIIEKFETTVLKKKPDEEAKMKTNLNHERKQQHKSEEWRRASIYHIKKNGTHLALQIRVEEASR